MRRRLLLASVAVAASLAGCRHHCHKWCHKKDDCCPPAAGSSNILLPPAGVPTTPGGPAPSPFPPPAGVAPGPSYFPPPANVVPSPLPQGGNPNVLFPDPLPGNPSSRATQPTKTGTNFLGAPVKPATAEPPKAAPAGKLPATKVKDGLYAGARPTLEGFDALKNAGFRSVIFLHGPGADVAAVKDMAGTRDLNFVAIEATPETLAEASKQFGRAAADRINRPAYVFADEPVRAGAVWYLHFRSAEALGDDVARLRAKPLGLSEQGEEGKAFALAIQRVLEGK